VLLADVEVEIEIATALAVLRRAVELGVDFIDTADSYGPNVSEESIAEALFPYPAGVVIATKGGWNRPGPNQWTHDATPAHLHQAVEGSLKRLRLDRIDVYQLHIPDPVVSFEASVETLAQLRNEGKIRLVALSNVTQEHIERAAKSSLSPLCGIATALSTASGITWWIIVSTTGLPLFRGSPWEQAKLLATC
jgi:pyridoxine 4-dehydrogenase